MRGTKYIVHVLAFKKDEELQVRAARSKEAAETIILEFHRLDWELVKYGKVELDAI